MNAFRPLTVDACQTLAEASRLGNLVQADSFYLSDEWLELLSVHGHVCQYLVVRDGAGCAMTPLGEGLSARSSRYGPSFLLMDQSLDESRYLVAGPMSGYRNALRFGTRPLPAVDVAQGLLDAATGKAVLFPYLDTRTAAAFEQAGHPAGAISWETWLDVPPDGFDGYCRGLPRAQRQRIASDLRRMDRAEVRFESEPLTGPFGATAGLLVAHERKYDPTYAGTPERFDHYLSLCAKVPGAYHITARHDGILVGAVIAFFYDGVLWTRLVGVDDSLAVARGCYFNLAFHEPIRLAHRIGAHAVHLGIGALQGKLWRGARAEPLWTAAIVAPGPGRAAVQKRLRARAVDLPDPVPHQLDIGLVSPTEALERSGRQS